MYILVIQIPFEWCKTFLKLFSTYLKCRIFVRIYSLNFFLNLKGDIFECKKFLQIKLIVTEKRFDQKPFCLYFLNFLKMFRNQHFSHIFSYSYYFFLTLHLQNHRIESNRIIESNYRTFWEVYLFIRMYIIRKVKIRTVVNSAIVTRCFSLIKYTSLFWNIKNSVKNIFITKLNIYITIKTKFPNYNIFNSKLNIFFF